MRKIYLTLLAALLALAAQAQQRAYPFIHNMTSAELGAPQAVCPPTGLRSPVNKLAANEWYVGYYTGDNIDYQTGLSMEGTYSAGTLMYPWLLADYAGCKVLGVRFAIGGNVEDYQSNGSRVFIQEVANGYYSDDVASQDIDEVQAGWNEVRFAEDQQYAIPTDGTTSLIVGFDYEQHENDMPLVFCKGGLTGRNLVYIPSGQYAGWNNIGTTTQDDNGNTVYLGNLAIQLIVEKAKPQVGARLLTVGTDKSMYKTGGQMTYGFILKNTGVDRITSYNMRLTADGNELATYSGTGAIAADAYDTVYANVTLPASLPTGKHQLGFEVTSINGSSISGGNAPSASFVSYDQTQPRQKTLIEHHTSNTCVYCPDGEKNLQALYDRHDNLAWVSIHGNLHAVDPNNTAQCDSIESYEGLVSFPSAAFNRVYLADQAGDYATNTYSVTQGGSRAVEYMEQIADSAAKLAPCFVTLELARNLDNVSRHLTLTVHGTGVTNASKILADDGLYVYLLEDSLHGKQSDGNNVVDDYVWNHVFRVALGKGVKGNDIQWDGDNFIAEFDYDLPEGWDIGKMSAVAFVGPKIDYSDNYVDRQAIDNCEVMALGSSASGIRSLGAADSDSPAVSHYYNVAGQRLSRPRQGLTIVRRQNGKVVKFIASK